MIRSPINTVLLSRVDNLGDAVLLIPLAGLIKRYFPKSRLLFLGQAYQRMIIESCRYFDAFLNWDEVREASSEQQAAFLAQHHIDVIAHIRPRRAIATAAIKAQIRHRIGSIDRIFHLFTCNHLPLQVRRWSKLHEAQLNIRLLSPLLKRIDYELDELESYMLLGRIRQYPKLIDQYLSRGKFNLILHPRSLGHAKEWKARNFANLVRLLPVERYNILVTGTRSEAEDIRDELLRPCQDRIHDLTGSLSLAELVCLISRADGLVAASTGPLHIAAATGIHTLGLYVMKWQLHPGRYGPIGKRATYMVYDENCPVCLADKECDCINLITPERVFEAIKGWRKLPIETRDV